MLYVEHIVFAYVELYAGMCFLTHLPRKGNKATEDIIPSGDFSSLMAP